MTRAWNAWVALWDRREPATAQALVRILVGACLVYDLLSVWRLGIVDVLWAAPPDGMATGADGSHWAFRWLGGSPSSGRLLFAGMLVAAVLLTVGCATRVAALALVLLGAQLAAFAPDSDRGIDAVLRAVALVLAFASAGGRWSVDASVRRRLGRPFAPQVPAWPRLLLLVQVVWVYFSSGLAKLDAEWGPVDRFSALGNVLSDPHYARFGDGWVPTLYPLTQVATAVVMVFELGAPAVLLFTWYEATADRRGRLRRLSNRLHLRWVWIGTGVLLHLGIAVFLRLGVFPYGMLALYPVLLRPGELRRAEAWLRSRGSVGAGEAALAVTLPGDEPGRQGTARVQTRPRCGLPPSAPGAMR